MLKYVYYEQIINYLSKLNNQVIEQNVSVTFVIHYIFSYIYYIMGKNNIRYNLPNYFP